MLLCGGGLCTLRWLREGAEVWEGDTSAGCAGQEALDEGGGAGGNKAGARLNCRTEIGRTGDYSSQRSGRTSAYPKKMTKSTASQ